MASLSSKSFLPPSISILLTPILIVLAVVGLFLAVFKIGTSRISSQRKQLKTAEENETILVQKQQILQSVQGTVLSYADASSVAMPRENPILVVFSQLKILAGKNSVVLNDVKVGSLAESKKGSSKATISFQIEGEFGQVLKYLADTGNAAPLSTIDKVEVSQAAGAVRATVSMSIYWAPFPEKLPPISEPIHELTAEELNLIEQLSDLAPPAFAEVSPATAPVVRQNPFSF